MDILDRLHKRVPKHRIQTEDPDSEGRRRLKNGGFTLVEVLVAAALLLFATSGIVPFFLSGLTEASMIRYKSMATNIARERMEEIRKLDYRDIENPDQLEGLFGGTVTQRDITFDIDYAVDTNEYEDGTLKQVTVTVGWTGPPDPSPSSISTMIHQQYLGPRGANLRVVSTTTDPLGTPFGVMDSSDIVYYQVAQLDWGLLFDDLDNPSTSATDCYLRLAFADDAGNSLQFGDEADDYKLDSSYLRWSTDGDGNLEYVWYQVPVNDMPFWKDKDGNATTEYGLYDGYWELRACAYNEYDQPGNIWRLRVRVENGKPDTPQDLTVVQTDNETIEFFWLPGSERDRDHYVLQRNKRAKDAEGVGWGLWSGWTTIAGDLPPDTVYYKDQGDAAVPTDPWGSDDQWNEYIYRLYSVDIDAQDGDYVEADVFIPPTAYATEYVLNVDWTPYEGGSVTVDPSQATYTAGTLVTLTAVPDEGYEFDSWSGDATGTDTSVTLTMDSSKTVTATFTGTVTPEYYSVTIENDTNKNYTVTIKDSGDNIVFTEFVAKHTSTVASNLLEGVYAISAYGGITISGSFSLPDQTSAIVLSLLE